MKSLEEKDNLLNKLEHKCIICSSPCNYTFRYGIESYISSCNHSFEIYKNYDSYPEIICDMYLYIDNRRFLVSFVFDNENIVFNKYIKSFDVPISFLDQDILYLIEKLKIYLIFS